jgi:pyridinium-3,5-bisthiocarboxylic acid mononucleotide nickel chelatase
LLDEGTEADLMARVMYLECFSGAAGDMLLGALIDAGLPPEALRAALGSLGVGHEIRVSRVFRCGISATKVDVLAEADSSAPTAAHTHDRAHSHGRAHGHSHGEDGHRSLEDIVHLVGHSALSATAKARASSLFRRIAEVEADIHGISADEVHLHEVGAVDSIIDIVGVVFAMEWFGIDDIVASPLNVGGGTVDIAHGRYPVPAPATLKLLAGVPVYSDGPKVELVTPTGALLVSSYARLYGGMPSMTVEHIGYGAGTRDTTPTPNVLRVVIGERAAVTAGSSTILKIEAEIDDMNPQLFGPASEQLFAEGAVDVFMTPVFMKKGRPGTLITVLAPPDRRQAMTDTLFRETTTIGVRVEVVERETLERRWDDVVVAGARIRIKVASRGGAILNGVPEFDDCVRVAKECGRPVKVIYTEAQSAWLRKAEGLMGNVGDTDR